MKDARMDVGSLENEMGGNNALADLMQANNVTIEEIQQAVASRGYYSAATPIENYDPDFVSGALVGAWPQVNKLILKIRETKLAAPNFGEPKVFCPDCGAELLPSIHQQCDEPFRAYLYFNCPGRCHVEACTREEFDPEQVHWGAPKFYILLGQNLKDRDQVDIRANLVLTALRGKPFRAKEVRKAIAL